MRFGLDIRTGAGRTSGKIAASETTSDGGSRDMAMRSPSRLSMLVFAVYMAGLGSGLLFVPARVLPLFGFAEPRDFWVRLLGGLLLILALYYCLAVREENRAFYRWTVWGRLPLIVLYTGLFLFAEAPVALLLIGVWESGCGLWTHLALRAEQRSAG
jgi:hypothetical protein